MLKKIGYLIVGTIVAAQLIGAGTSAIAQTPAAAPPVSDKKVNPENMKKALAKLRQVQSELESAGGNYGGHRAKAVELISEAQKELNKGIDYAAARKSTNTGGLDINSASADELRSLPMVDADQAMKIRRGRPYATKDELLKRGIVNQATYDKIKDMIVANPPKK